MKTEISKTYKSGFVLTEQELRRIIQAATEHAQKIAADKEYALCLEVTLKDGSIIEFDKTDDVFSLENAGAKLVNKVTVTMRNMPDNEPWEILLMFQNALHNPSSSRSSF